MSEPKRSSPLGSTLVHFARVVALGVVIAAVLFAGYLGLAYFGI